ncbi:Npun_F5749 family FMN-dependent PPOX-type flavoprotein [Egbenema bharatensis]|uniref:Npun_F5749 family FMN-dependent PPOX-type flavoprotein n=1 Tax=Egbenema bharatensis TaxID=3463334 RepID=UPI003A845109
MPLAPWRSPLSRALHHNRSLSHARYLQLATVRPNGQPANRTIVFRGFLDSTNSLKFVTDRRSEKADQIPLQNWGEVCWYFPKTREQFRLLGRLILVEQDHSDPALCQVRTTQWQDLSDSARLQFAWPDPKQPRADDAAFQVAPPDSIHPLPNFCLLLLEPIEVDHLELRGQPQNRTLYQQESGDEWRIASINP